MIPEDIGIVAIGRNEGERLLRCLESIKSAASNIANKIVYVDSGSTDGSIAAAERIGARVVALDLSRPFTAARARNEGFAALKALSPDVRFVQFIDGDCVLARGWLDEAHDFIGHRSDIAIVCGRRRELHPTASVYNLLCDIEWDTPVGEATTCGGDTLVRVEAFEMVGGFRPQLIAGEEPELCVRLRQAGWKIWRLDVDMTQHDAAMTRLRQFWTRAVRAGFACAEVSQLHKGSPYGIWGRETLSSLFWGGFLPAAICLGSLVSHTALLGAIAYPLQICRIALARGIRSAESWKYAVFITVAKFAEFQGILMRYWRQLGRRNAKLIEYK
jgi:GT2 family glycosyltransferase